MRLLALVATAGLFTSAAAAAIQEPLNIDPLKDLPHGISPVVKSVAAAANAQSGWAPDHKGSEDALPLVIWHGLGDNYKADGLRSVGDLASETIEGLYVYYVHLADDETGDRDATFFGNLTLQIDQVCEQLAADPILSTAPAINALGFSQGGQFLRGYVERCNNPPVANLVTFGSQHNGIAEFQDCDSGDWVCRGFQGVLKGNTWSGFVQNRLVPAQYYRNPEDLENYIEYSNFLADINNERDVKNTTYSDNLKKLQKFVMYVFDEDTTVIPRQSGWFSEYNRTSEQETKLQNRTMYKEDWLGLKWLDEHDRLVFETTPGQHMRLTDKVLKEVFQKYFAPEQSSISGPVSSFEL